ncbi:glutamate racemase [Paenibacillus flagellatus]|uniref:Glutamate racemase n=1 Tax=Paenibacillus flagellatus TaxID=2211139 RepID=A0A2V5K9H7_9BACL|nr:glutamate racemase [Paenibacillus flagellatus]PYI56149.1 glutamate racemase [Paenibacillus flagellatus]
MQRAIAILDSGVGGLTVAKEVMRQLPQEEIIYFGDNARAPYGPRAADEVMEFTEQIVGYLLQFQPKMIVIACNTATAIALQRIRSQVDIPVVGVIHPGARAAIKKTKNGCVGVIGTENTIRSGAYQQALQSISPTIQVVSLACPKLVPLVENRMFRSEEARQVVAESLRPLANSPIDCLILGCTHYPFLAPALSEVVGPRVSLISSADETAREISAILYHRGQLAQSGKLPVHRFFCSGNPGVFQAIAQEWLGEQIRVSPVMWQMTRLSAE